MSNVQSIGSGVINGFKNVLAQLGVAVPDGLPSVEDIDLPDINLPSVPSIGEFSLADWPLLCKVVWWPHEDEHCKSMRCAACSTAMIAAGKVCEKTQGSVDHRCLRDVLLDGACGYCAVDFLA